MAKLNIGSTPQVIVSQEESFQEVEEKNEIMGLSEEEYNDPNKIQITIANKEIPIVVLYGPAACGKTMTLVRLTRWLKSKGYKIEPVRNFRPAKDSHYKKMCDEYNTMVSKADAAESTTLISFMLIKVSDQYGHPLCQILEAPGEYYFKPSNPTADYPTYVQHIANSTNRKIWCMMVEPDWLDQEDRDNYVSKIQGIKSKMSHKDNVIFIYNKIDLTGYVISVGNVNTKEAYKDVENNYPGIFERYRTSSIFFGKTDRFKFIPFQTGNFTSAFDGSLVFTAGHDYYPQTLWDAIFNYIKG